MESPCEVREPLTRGLTAQTNGKEGVGELGFKSVL